MNVSGRILVDMGSQWVENTLGRAEPRNTSDIADLVYFHYLESEDGQRVWFSDSKQTENQVDYIFESLHDRYVEELEWMTEDDWQVVSDELYSMVHEGVF